MGDASGQEDEQPIHEVYVDAFPSQGRRHQVSTSGGLQPRWRRDGKAKQPFYMTTTDGSSLALAGLWSTWFPQLRRIRHLNHAA